MLIREYLNVSSHCKLAIGNDYTCRVCCRSPIVPARPAFSAEMLPKSISDYDLSSKVNIWTNSESVESVLNNVFYNIILFFILGNQQHIVQTNARIVTERIR